MRVAKRVFILVTCVIVITLCVVLFQEFNTEVDRKYRVLTEPVRDALSIRSKPHRLDSTQQENGFKTVPLKGDLGVISLDQNVDKLKLDTWGKPIQSGLSAYQLNGDHDKGPTGNVFNSDGSAAAAAERYMVAGLNGSVSEVVSQIEPTLLAILDDVINSDTTRQTEVVYEGVRNFTCPDSIRVINGVEDLLCMVSHRLLWVT